MAIPNTSAGLEAAGYIFKGRSKCKYCKAEIYWYETPRGKKMPVSAVPGTERGHRRCEPHFNACRQMEVPT
jgi:hypothetical protein